MAKSNKERQAALRKERAASGLKEMRGVWVTASEEKEIKQRIKTLLDELRK